MKLYGAQVFLGTITKEEEPFVKLPKTSSHNSLEKAAMRTSPLKKRSLETIEKPLHEAFSGVP